MAVRTVHQCTAAREFVQALLIGELVRLQLHVIGGLLRLGQKILIQTWHTGTRKGRGKR